MSLQVNLNHLSSFISENEFLQLQSDADRQYNALLQKTGKGNDFLGWVTLPDEIGEEEISRIEAAANRIRKIADVLVVVGIGGSYLGARAVIEALSNHFSHLQSKEERNAPLVVYAGQNLCADYTADLMEMLKDKSYCVAVISKSGTTTEPAIAFRLLKQDIEQRYGKSGAAQRIIAITDANKGALRQLADTEGYETFNIADDIGGRYSVLSPVGLLPVAVAGIDIRQLLNGAKSMKDLSSKSTKYSVNPVMAYAIARNLLYKKGKKTEILASYHPRLVFMSEWWKQLYGESEGKENKGIFTAAVNFTTDLHSLGQWVQEGERTIFETVITVEKTKNTVLVPKDEADLDKLNYIAAKSLAEVNQQAQKGTLLAHLEGGVPNIMIEIDQISAFTLGELIYFFEKACAISGYILGVNPFDQPGVEAYKTNMFALLGKAGFEELATSLRAKL